MGTASTARVQGFEDRIQAQGYEHHRVPPEHLDPGDELAPESLWNEAVNLLTNAYRDAPDWLADRLDESETVPAISDGFDGTVNIYWETVDGSMLLSLHQEEHPLVTYAIRDNDEPSGFLRGERSATKSGAWIFSWLKG